MRSSSSPQALTLLDAANWLLGMLFVLLLSVFILTRVWAATPSNGTISLSSPAVHWGGDEPSTGADSATDSNETGCIDTPGSPLRNCDTFTLTVAPGNYTGKSLNIAVSWTLPTDEYDLFVHEGPTDSTADPVIVSSTHGPNGDTTVATQNAVQLSLGTNGIVVVPTVYTVHVANVLSPGVAGENTDQYVGNATLISTTPDRTATYTNANSMFKFSNDVPLKAPVTVSDGEPSNRTDSLGNFYESGIRGFPAGVDLWYFDLNPNSPTYDPLMEFPQYRGQPDGFTGQTSAKAGINAGGDGGGDIDLAVLFPTDGSTPTLAFASLIAANLSTGNTTDMGMNYTLNPVGTSTGGIPANDRQWLAALNGSTVYILYRTLDPVVSQIQQSTDGGITYGPFATTGQTAQTGSLDVDPVDGTVVAGFDDGTVAVGTPSLPATLAIPNPAPLSTDYHTYQAATDPNGVAHIFFECQVARDSATNGSKSAAHPKGFGTLYALYSNDTDIFLQHSLNRGVTWSAPVRVDDPATVGADHPKFNIFPRLALGTKFGSVGIVWYGTNNLNAAGTDDGSVSSNSRGGPDAKWRVFYALTYNATSATPSFMETTVSNHYIHAGNVSEGGLVVTGANPNRNLLDYFEVSFDPKGAAVIGYTDDHNDFSGECFSVRQIGGPSINSGVSVPTPHEGPAAARQTTPAAYVTAPIPGPFGAQVTDFVGDESYGLVATAPGTDPLDITAVKYYGLLDSGGPSIVAKMTVSNLSTIPLASTWRMSFAANCPNAALDPTGTFSTALSDLGDQFYLEADTGPSGAQTATWGTAVRSSDGSLTYTMQGNTDSVTFDTTGYTITVSLPISALNQYLKGLGHPIITRRSILSGLRGSAFDATGTAKEDSTYGGTEYIYPYTAP